MFGLGQADTLSLRSGRPCEAPKPAKCVQVLFRGEHGLGVWKLAAEQSHAEWYSGRQLVGGLDGCFTTVEGRMLDSGSRVSSFGLGHMAEVVFHRRLLGGSFGGRGQRWLPSGDWGVDVL